MVTYGKPLTVARRSTVSVIPEGRRKNALVYQMQPDNTIRGPRHLKSSALGADQIRGDPGRIDSGRAVELKSSVPS
ncbi:MAG: hypothetical protein Kow0025_18870 [Thermodesulfovibrionales bacterium]